MIFFQRIVNLMKSFYSVVIQILWKMLFWIKLRWNGAAINLPFRGNAAYLSTSKRVIIGSGVTIRARAHLSVLDGASLTIGSGTLIGGEFVLSCANVINIGENVLIADRCFVADSIHEYEDVSRPIMLQGMKKGQVSIGDGCWIGINTSIMPDVSIGRHCVIGANSVVTKDIPDYSVACGVPAEIVRRYRLETQSWTLVKKEL